MKSCFFSYGLLALFLFSCSTHSEGIAKNPVIGSEQPRLLIFISDLHVGVGKKSESSINRNTSNAKKTWSNTEDFHWEEEFRYFLDFISKEGKGKTDLIVVGDMMELWQSSKVRSETRNSIVESHVLNCEHGDSELGCTEVEVFDRFNRVIREHSGFFKALSDFVNKDDNHIFILPGNHDAGILYPKVTKRILSAISAPEGRVTIATSGIWLSRDGLILADHGHQFDKVNRFANWPEPFVIEQGERYLYRPWGEQMVQQFYNQYEEFFPVIDNLSSEGLGVRLGLAALDAMDISVAINRFFKFLLYHQSWDQAISFLGEEETLRSIDWDIVRVREEESFDKLLDCFDFNDPIRILAKKDRKAGEVKIRMSDLTNEEIWMVCDCRSRLARMQSEAGASRIVSECPVKEGTLGHIGDKLMNRYNANLRIHLLETHEALKTMNPKARYYKFYIHGHTHHSHSGIPLSIDPSIGWSVLFFNSGAFQRIANPEQIKEIQRERGLSDYEILRVLRPGDLPPCYSYIRVDPYNEKPEPNPVLRFWVKEGEKSWTEKKICP